MKCFSSVSSGVQAELSLSQRKMCCELSRLKGEDIDERLLDPRSSISDTQQVNLPFKKLAYVNAVFLNENSV